MPDLEARVAARLANLKDWCEEHAIETGPAGEVDEPTACRLLWYPSPKALRRQAIEGRLSPVLRRRHCGPRWLYSLDSIAEYIELEYDRWAVS